MASAESCLPIVRAEVRLPVIGPPTVSLPAFLRAWKFNYRAAVDAPRAGRGTIRSGGACVGTGVL